MSESDSIDVIADPVEKIACRKCGRHLDVSKLPFFSEIECPDCQTHQTVPAQLGQFLLLEILGAGGMGAVYMALDKSLGRYVAIKVMKRAMGDDPQFVDNFLREARAAAALNHRNVVQIYSCGQEKGQPYIVMELVSGGRLDEMVATGNPLDEVRALEIGVDVAEGLKAANDIGLIHGDVKPANILFDKEGVAKVADFGLARFVAWQQQDRGEVWGTPYYIAPEKARGQKVDHRSDIYSLGATLYHALGAKPPFDGKTATDVVLARLKNPAIGLRVVRPTLQPETADVIARMLEGDPFMRYPTYSSLLADIREALRVAKQEQRSVRTKVKKSRAVPALIAGSVIVLSIVGLVFGLRSARVREQERVKEAEQKAIEEAQKAVQQQQEEALKIEEELKKEKEAKILAIKQPFSAKHEEAIAAAIGQLEQGNAAAMREQLQNLFLQRPESDVGRFWIRLFQAVAAWAGGRDPDAILYLKEIRNAFFESPDGVNIHPGIMCQTLAKYMLGEIGEGAVAFETAKWDPWFGDLAEFFVALRHLQDGDAVRAEESFTVYAGKERTSCQWPYSLQPVAKQWAEQVQGFRAQSSQVAELIAARQAAKARAMLDEFRARTTPIIYPLISREMELVRGGEAKEAELQKIAERRAHEDKVQADLDRLDGIRAQNLVLVAQKDYRRAAVAVLKLVTEMKTPEGQQALAALRETYDQMDSLKRFLIARISASPFKGAGTELRGDAIGADLNGIKVALGTVGGLVMPWPEITPRLMLQLVNNYLNDPAVADPEKAAMNLAAAVYCYESGGLKPAATYAETACKLSPDLKTTVRRLMPDLLPD